MTWGSCSSILNRHGNGGPPLLKRMAAMKPRDKSYKEKGMTQELREIFEKAQSYHRRNGYDLNESELLGRYEDTRMANWHHCLALAVNEIDGDCSQRLRLFSQCVLRLGEGMNGLRQGDAREPPF